MPQRFPEYKPSRTRLLSIAVSCLLLGLWYPITTFGSHPAGPVPAIKDEREEVYLSFRYQGVGNVVVTAIYNNGNFYLPVSELFSLLMVNHSVEMASSGVLIRGFFLEEDNRYEIDFSGGDIRLGNESRELVLAKSLIGELDFYLLPEVFEDVFSLEFNVDMNNLTLRLETNQTMPVVQSLERRSARGNLLREQVVQEDYPLMFNRQRKWLGGGFLDYNFSGNFEETGSIYNYNLTSGAELLGGDLQGNMLGTVASGRHFFRTSNMRWRYVIRDQPLVSSVSLGQLNSQGLVSRNYTGFKLTNDPIEPRRMYDQHRIQGNTAPDSEIEVYLNNRLIEYARADELGNYNFTVPLTFGSTRMRVMVYRPDGTISEQEKRIQIPYTFLPPGHANYTVNAGMLDNPTIPGKNREIMMQSNAAYGISNWLTLSGGVDYVESIGRALGYGSLSGRIATQYLVNLDIAPEAFYRLQTNVVYSNSASLGGGVTHYASEESFYNRSGNKQDMNANIFLPFSIKELPLSLRVSGIHRIMNSGSTSTMLRSDFSVRVKRLSLRLGYRESITGRPGMDYRHDGSVSATAMYTVSRRSGLPDYLGGTSVRTKVDYRAQLSGIERMGIQLSRSLWGAGRLRLSYERNMIVNVNSFEAGLTIDFNRTRSSTTSRFSGGTGSIRQNFRGSVGYDDYHNKVILENRQQVGRSAASVRMFIDHNNSGLFDEDDEVIPDNAIRLRRAGSRKIGDSGITRISQLQAYHKHNIEINQSAIRNPSLVPKFSEFSFIGDPNSYKTMDIPFYMTGIIEGSVRISDGESNNGIGGVRVHLNQTDGDYSTVMRTFSDGGYYAMEIPPGQYEARVDSSQLTFLNVLSDPEVVKFTVESMAQGDYVENLDFILKRIPEIAE
ncbi:MAG: hypothetical protein WD625_03005 [Balneolales bacterium]